MAASYNIAYDIVGDRIVSTAAIECSAMLAPPGMMQYETIIWTNENGAKGEILHWIYHYCEREAKKVHGYIVTNLTPSPRSGERSRE